ncbi:MAG: SIMPL domain-containing protein [Bacteroidetes bacterium]|nr:SIMPL domain-containing protein [Bacteroidota bacterium]
MKKLITLLVLFTFINVNSQSLNVPSLIDRPFIEITGTSETEVTPDEIYVTITLQERAENKEKLNIDKQEESLKSSLKELNIDLNNLTLNTANSDFRKVKSIGKDVIISKSYSLKLNNVDILNKVYEKLDLINAHDAFISKLNHTKILDFQKENRIKAIKAAKDKAEYLLVAVGKQIGNPIQIIETENSTHNTPYNYYRGRSMANTVQSYNAYTSDAESNKHDISIKKIKVVSSFMVKYEIK